MRCVIIAAGRGTRMSSQPLPKPLVRVGGLSLLERVMASAAEAGLTGFVVVTGHRAEEVAAHAREVAARRGLEVEIVPNPQWERGNAASVLTGARAAGGRFVLAMADHVLAPEIFTRLLKDPPAPGEIALAVDTAVHNPLVDMDDVTRVQLNQGRVVAIGKGLTPFSGFDTGAFVCTEAIIPALERSLAEGDGSLTWAVRLLASKGRVKAVDVTGLKWVDVDEPEAIAKAEHMLLRSAGAKPTDGPVARHINRPVSARITRWLIHTPLTPNHITLIAFGLSLVGAAMMAAGSWAWLAAGGLMVQLASIVDGCDGEVARIKHMRSDYGAWMDAVLDRYSDGIVLGAMAIGGWAMGGGWWAIIGGWAAIVGSFVVSYTADKYDAMMRARMGRGVRIGRDIRLGLVAVGAVAGLPTITLWTIGVLMNLEGIRRVYVCRQA